LFEEQALFPNIRHETIHQVKGESIGAVLAIGGAKFWNSVATAVVSGFNNEDRRLAYVAMTRAKDLLVLSLPSDHFDKHIERWRGWGFESLQWGYRIASSSQQAEVSYRIAIRTPMKGKPEVATRRNLHNT